MGPSPPEPWRAGVLDRVLAYLEPWEVAAWHHSRQLAGRALDDSLQHPTSWLVRITAAAVVLFVMGRALRGGVVPLSAPPKYAQTDVARES